MRSDLEVIECTDPHGRKHCSRPGKPIRLSELMEDLLIRCFTELIGLRQVVP